MDTDVSPWLLVHHRMILPHPGTHTAERNKQYCHEGCAMLVIDETMLLAVVRDTTTHRVFLNYVAVDTQLN